MHNAKRARGRNALSGGDLRALMAWPGRPRGNLVGRMGGRLRAGSPL